MLSSYETLFRFNAVENESTFLLLLHNVLAFPSCLKDRCSLTESWCFIASSHNTEQPLRRGISNPSLIQPEMQCNVQEFNETYAIRDHRIELSLHHQH